MAIQQERNFIVL